MTTALSFDQATVTGWCYGGTKIELPEWKTGHFRAPKRPLEGERLILIEDGALELIDRFTPDIVVFEEPFDPAFTDVKEGRQRFNINRNTVHFLQRVKGAILMAAARRYRPAEGYAPRTWRSALGLPSKPHVTLEDIKARAEVAEGAPRPRIAGDEIKKLTREAVRRLGGKVETLDEADAWGLCYYALHGKAGARRAQGDLLERVKATL